MFFFLPKMSLRILYLRQFSGSKIEIICAAANMGSHFCTPFKFGWCVSKASNHSLVEGFLKMLKNIGTPCIFQKFKTATLS